MESEDFNQEVDEEDEFYLEDLIEDIIDGQFIEDVEE